MSQADFADWVLTRLDLDTWFNCATLQRRLVGIHGHTLSASRLLGALRNAGWVDAHPTYPETYCLASKCWWPAEKPKSIS